MHAKSAARCLCCGYRTLSSPEALDLCPVCWWQDDGQDDTDADAVWRAANGALSLADARRNFQQFGAAHPKFVVRVRAPQPQEMPA